MLIYPQGVRRAFPIDKRARKTCFAYKILALCAIAMYSPTLMRADTGIVVYGSKGMDQRRTDSGHIALIVTDLCASGVDQVRECRDGERPGIVITAYANLASDYSKSVFVLPMLDHFAGTDNVESIPVLSSGASLRAAQIEYWRNHLRPYFPPMTQQRYTEIRDEMERFDAGRELRRFLTMEFIGTMLGSHKHQDATEPIALIDPLTKELIPDGRWREAVGAEQMRSAVVITAPASLEQELHLIRFLKEPQAKTFNVMSENCSDFVQGALMAVYGDSGLHFRPRSVDFADAWITSPLFVATGFVSFAKKKPEPLRVVFLPIIAGTRRSHFSVHSISRGALVPEPSQGKMAFTLKTYINVLNPLLGITSFTVDQMSRLVNLPRTIHDCSDGDLLSVGMGSKTCSGKDFDQRDRVRVFGTPSCWKKKQDEFQKLASRAVEIGLLNRDEEKRMLKRGQPFLLARLYEHPVADKNQNQSLIEGMRACFLPGCTNVESLLKNPLSSNLSADDIIPGRSQVRLLSESSEQTSRETAFKLMATVINYDLSSEPTDRRTVQSFDQDWQLFLHTTERSHLTVQGSETGGETLETCSCNSFDAGAERKDALQEARGFSQRVMRAERELVTSPVR